MSEYLSVYPTESGDLSSEVLERLDIASAISAGLLRAIRNHRALGEAGKAKDIRNQFGEIALRADFEAELNIIEEVSFWATKRDAEVSFTGEEIASGGVGKEGGKKYFLVVDGLDGSANYLKPCAWSYGTMVAIADKEKPSYKDFQVAGIALPEEGWWILAIKDRGVFVTDVKTGKTTQLPRFGQVEYDEEKVLADNYFPEAQKMLGELQRKWPRTGSYAASIAALAIRNLVRNEKFPVMNQGWQGLVDVTRKGNLEQPVGYLILAELGGTVVDESGQDIGEYAFADWGQTEKTPIVSAASLNVARGILSRLNM